MVTSEKRLMFLLEHYWEQRRGGAELQSYYLESAALRLGLTTYYCFLSNGNFIEKKHDTIICPIPKKYIWSKLNSIQYPYALVVYQALKKIKPDVIYQRCASALTGIAALYAKKNICQLTFHIASDMDVGQTSIPWEKPWLVPEYKLKQYGIKNADTIIVQTQFQAEQLIKNYDRKAIVIPNGHPVPEDCIKTDGQIKVLWVNNWKAVKQPEVFVKLVEAIGREENIRFVMIGRTGRYFDLVELAKKNNIEVMGEISNDQVNNLLSQSHILVNTSWHEGFSNTFIQAWLRRVPVVSLQVDPDNIIQNKQIGLCSSGNFLELVKNTKKLIKDDKLRNTMGDKARKHAIKHHSLKNIDKIIETIIR